MLSSVFIRHSLQIACLGFAFLAAAPSAFAATKTWDSGGSDSNCSTAANWNGDTLPSSSDDIVINASGRDITWDSSCPQTVNSFTIGTSFTGSLTVNTVYGGSGFTVFTVAHNLVMSGGTITHSQNTTSETYRLRLAVGGDVTVASGATISANGKGYYKAAGFGPNPAGVGTGAVKTRWYATGGSYGGQGGRDAWNAVWGPTYGSITEPIDIGSTGTVNNGGPSAAGGAILLTVTGATTVDGIISANGNDVTSCSSYVGGPSGGSVYITTGSFGGGGTVSVNGGSSYGCGYGGGGGGGGRMAIVLTNASTFGDVRLRASGGGYHDSWDNTQGGAAGTIFLRTKDETDATGQLTIPVNYLYYNVTNGVSPSTIPLSGVTEYPTSSHTTLSDTQPVSYTFSSVTIDPRAHLEIDGGDSLTITSGGTLSIGESGALIANISFDLSGLTFTNNGLIEGTGTFLNQSALSVSPSTGTIGGTITATLTDADANTNGTIQNTVIVHADGEDFTLTENGNATGVFTGPIPTKNAERTAGNGIIDRNDACTFTTGVYYVDPEDSTDASSTSFTINDNQISTCNGTASASTSHGGSRRGGGGAGSSAVPTVTTAGTTTSDSSPDSAANAAPPSTGNPVIDARIKDLDRRSGIDQVKLSTATGAEHDRLQEVIHLIEFVIGRLRARL